MPEIPNATETHKLLKVTYHFQVSAESPSVCLSGQEVLQDCGGDSEEVQILPVSGLPAPGHADHIGPDGGPEEAEV